MRLITTGYDGTRSERELADETEYRQVLKDLFGIHLDQDERRG
jgi:hypothetical protein